MEAADGNATLPAQARATTIPRCDATFARPSAFGLFLTLTFCLLTQPQGTLLYPSPSKPHGLTLALLRLYPPYCLTETAVIIKYLTRSMWCAWRDGHRPKLQATSTNKWYQTRLSLNLRPCTSQIRMTAAALLSVRSGKQATLLATLRAQTPSQEVELGTTPHYTTRPGQATTTGTDPTPGTLPRRRNTYLEEGTTLGTSEAPRDETIISAVDPNVLAHRQILVYVVAFFSVLTIMAKLAFSTLPWTIRFTAWPLVVGWMGLHALPFIFHSGGDNGINSLEPAALVRELRMIEAELNRLTAHRGFMVSSFFNIVSCGFYLSWLVSKPYIGKPEKLISADLGEFWVVFFVLILAVMFVFLFLFVPYVLFPPSVEIRSWEKVVVNGISLMLSAASGGGVMATYIWRSQADAWWTENYVGLIWGLLNVAGVFAMLVSTDQGGTFDGFYSLFVKTSLMAAPFYLIVVSYNVGETCKPGWLDYLG
ncbi:hypothetical protein B0T18DRAFT_122376 [Schizothecium vesticola]|uniref:Uncharacterized protein n=1 Tax=Schizothecium vesticola TaxID=314040 RepID=A0AA40F2R3_9PEZI|nr:hypothetical protein B0T18DRAFT_122376 [Schizothecium vesticola]